MVWSFFTSIGGNIVNRFFKKDQDNDCLPSPEQPPIPGELHFRNSEINRLTNSQAEAAEEMPLLSNRNINSWVVRDSIVRRDHDTRLQNITVRSDSEDQSSGNRVALRNIVLNISSGRNNSGLRDFLPRPPSYLKQEKVTSEQCASSPIKAPDKEGVSIECARNNNCGTRHDRRCRRLPARSGVINRDFVPFHPEDCMDFPADVIADLYEAFQHFDRDKNGYITAAELRATMQSLGNYLSDEELSQMIAVADIKNDGKIDFNEWVRVVAFKLNGDNLRDALASALDALKEPHNGFMNSSTLRKALSEHGTPMRPGELDEFMKTVDTWAIAQPSAWLDEMARLLDK